MGGFANSVVGGMGKLIRSFIQSPNYQAGAQGWTVNKDGTVEFNSGTFRGPVAVGQVNIDSQGIITLTAINGSKIILDPTQISPVIEFTSQDGTNNAFLNAVTAGSTSRVDPGLNGGAYYPADGIKRRFRVWLDAASDLAVFECIDEATQNRHGGAIQIGSDRIYMTYNDPNGNSFYTRMDSNGWTSNVGLSVDGEPWYYPNINAPYLARGGNYPPPRYRKTVSPFNAVQLDGQISLNGAASGAIIFTLPAGYRPKTYTATTALMANPGPSGVDTEIDTAGNVRLWGHNGTGPAAFYGYFVLD